MFLKKYNMFLGVLKSNLGKDNVIDERKYCYKKIIHKIHLTKESKCL